MTKQEFENHYSKENITVDFYKGEDEIDFLTEYIEVFWNYNKSIWVDEYIWLIVDFNNWFYSKIFLQDCIQKNLKWIEAYHYYQETIENLREL